MKKIGIYGGSFDPVHLGHEWIANRALQAGLDHLVIMPCFISPHKLDQQPKSSAEDRLGMLRSAFASHPSIEVSDWEIQRGSISYTWETIDFLKKNNPEAKIVLLLGGDQFQVIESWTRYPDWAHIVEFLVFPRRGENNDFEKQKQAGLNFKVVADFPPEISSSEIRASIQAHGLWNQWVSAGVRDWILSRSLYDRS